MKGKGKKKPIVKEEPSAEEVQKQVRETLEKLQGKTKKGKGAKYRREKRDLHRQQLEKDLELQEAESKVIKVTEFVTANEVATMMNVSVTEVISACMSLGMMISMSSWVSIRVERTPMSVTRPRSPESSTRKSPSL